MIRKIIGLLVTSLCIGCGGTSTTGPQLPADAGEAIKEAHALILESTYGGGQLKNEKDLSQFETRFPKAVAAIKSGEVKMVWGKAVKDNSPSPEIIAYEKSAESGEGWAIKDNGKLEKATAADLPKGK